MSSQGDTTNNHNKTTSALRAKIQSEFAKAGLSRVPPDILSQCVGIASTLRVSPQQMALCWEAFSLNRKVPELNDRWMPSFKNDLIKQAKHAPPELLHQDVDDVAGASDGASDDANNDAKTSIGAVLTSYNPSTKKRDTQGLHMITPPAKKATPPAPSLASSSSFHPKNQGRTRVSLSPGPLASLRQDLTLSHHPYQERTNAGAVVYTYNPHNLDKKASTTTATTSPRCTLSYNCYSTTNAMKSYRHMFTTLEERALALDQHLVHLEVAMKTKFGIQEATMMMMMTTTATTLTGGDGAAATESAATTTTSMEHAEQENGASMSSSDIAPLEAVGVPRPGKVCCIGRICNSAHQGRINETSILLEGSRYSSGGQRVPLDLSYLKQQQQQGAGKASYSLFPGQIVAVEGINATGRKLVAHRICEGAALEAETSSPLQLLETYYPDRHPHDHDHDHEQDTAPLQMMVACGPFTTSDNLDYQPLKDLLNQVKMEQPDVVLLCGPFVDLKHEKIASGHVTLETTEDHDGTAGVVSVPYETLFANKVAEMIEELYETFQQQEESSNGQNKDNNNNNDGELMTQFVLVPSLDDATAEWVYPQPPFANRSPKKSDSQEIPGGEGIDSTTLGLYRVETAGRDDDDDDDDAPSRTRRRRRRHNRNFKRIHCVSNPCTFRINEVVVGVTSTDVLFHMSAEETNANLESGSRLGRLCQHLLQQQSYYPLFPAFLHKANLDLKQMDRWCMPCQPDILIVPSTLKTFAQTVLERTVVVNPGRLTMGTLGGTYATVEIHPPKRETLEQAVNNTNAGECGDDNNNNNNNPKADELFHNVQDRTRIEIKRI